MSGVAVFLFVLVAFNFASALIQQAKGDAISALFPLLAGMVCLALAVMSL